MHTTTPFESDPTRCYACRKRGPLLQCGRCTGAAYCDAECQRNDWPQHKRVCALLRQAKALPPDAVPPSGILAALVTASAPPAANVRTATWPPAPSFAWEPAYVAAARAAPADVRVAYFSALAAFRDGDGGGGAGAGAAPPPASARLSRAAAVLRGLDVPLRAVTDGAGVTLLHLAAAAGDDAAVRVLLRGGADVAAASNVHPAPLHIAALRGHPVVAQLLAAGADPNQLCCVQRRGYVGQLGGGEGVAVPAPVAQPPAPPAPPLVPVAARGPAGDDGPLNAAEDVRAWWAPLHWAALCPDAAAGAGVTEALLAAGARPAQRGGRERVGWTPLHLAALNGLPRTVATLLAGGAPAGARVDLYGATALDVSSSWRWASAASLDSDDRAVTAAMAGQRELIDRLNMGTGQEDWGLRRFRTGTRAEARDVALTLVRGGSDPTAVPPFTHDVASGPPRSPCGALAARGGADAMLGRALAAAWAARPAPAAARR